MTIQEQSAKVHAAIEAYIAALPDSDGVDVGMLGDWLAVVSMVAVDDEGRPRTQYYLIMRDGSLLPHVALGLLQVGVDEVGEKTQGG